MPPSHEKRSTLGALPPAPLFDSLYMTNCEPREPFSWKEKPDWMASWLIFKPQQNPKSSQLRLKPGFMDTANNIKSSVKKKKKRSQAQ